MYEFISSPDGRYYVSLKDNILTCCYEGTLLYKEELKYNSVKLLCCANNANLITLADSSIVLIPPDKKTEHRTIKGLTKKDLLNEQAAISAIYIDELGQQLCVGKISMHLGLRNKLKTFFSFDRAGAKDKECHSISFISLLADKQKEYFDDNFDTKAPNKFCWHISKDFTWLALAQPVKAIGGIATDVKLINVMKGEIYAESRITNALVKSVIVNKEGTILADTSAQGENAVELLFQNNKVKKRLEYDSDCEVKHLGNDYVVFLTKDHRVMAKSFDDKILCDASLAPLEEMGVPYHIHFMDKSNLNIIEAINDELKIVRTSIELINTDSKRWSFIQKSMEEQKIAEAQKDAEKSERDMLYQRKKAELAKTIQIKSPAGDLLDEPPEKPQEELPENSREKFQDELQKQLQEKLQKRLKEKKLQKKLQEERPEEQQNEQQEESPAVEPETEVAAKTEAEIETVPEKSRQKISPIVEEDIIKPVMKIPKEIADQLVYDEELSMPVKNLDQLALENVSQNLSDLAYSLEKPAAEKVTSLEVTASSKKKIEVKSPEVLESAEIEAEKEKPACDNDLEQSSWDGLFHSLGELEDLQIEPVRKKVKTADLGMPAEPKAEVKTEPTVETVELKVEPAVETKTEVKIEPKAKTKAEAKKLDSSAAAKIKTEKASEKRTEKTQKTEKRKTSKEEPVEDSKQNEKLKITKLVDMLDERFIKGEVTEAVYKELKDKYLKKLKDLKK